MKEKSQDFMVDVVNTDAGMGTNEVLIIVIVAAAVAIGIIWWMKRKKITPPARALSSVHSEARTLPLLLFALLHHAFP